MDNLHFTNVGISPIAALLLITSDWVASLFKLRINLFELSIT